jgi:allophanate hydrolase subunit 2
VIEIIFGNCEFQFLCATFICISGGDFSPKINHKSIKLNKKISVSKHDILSFGKINFGARSYFAVLGGMQSEKKLKSRSFYKGITKNFALIKGLEIPIRENITDVLTSNASIKIDDLHFNSPDLICTKGPEFELLNSNLQKRLFENSFSISKDVSRMGYRLNELIENDVPALLTSSVLPGTVQLTPSGTLIILTRDCQVTGGYPRILQLSEKAINILSQKTAGQKIDFSI